MARTPKTIKASRKPKIEELSQAHGALDPVATMRNAFGLKDVYDVSTLDAYKAQIRSFSTPDLHAHAHKIGLVPLDPKEKLFAALERKFSEVKGRAIPASVVPVKANPEFAEFHRQFMQGTFK